MSEVVAATAPEVRNLARELVEDWTRLAAELALVSGPYASGNQPMNRLLAESRDKLGSILEIIRDEPRTREFRGILEEFVDGVQTPLAKASFREPEKATSFFRAALTNCLALRDRLAHQFQLPIPTRRSAGDSAGACAILVVDVVGYSEQIARLRPTIFPPVGKDGLVRVLQQIQLEIREALAKAVEAEPSRRLADHLLRLTGDGALLRFRTVKDALAVASALLGSTTSTGVAPDPSTPYQFRVGIAYGVVMEIGGPLSDAPCLLAGLPLVVANRMNTVCPPGGIVISNDAWMRLLQVETPGGVDLRRDPFLSRFREQTVAGKHDEEYHCWVHSGSQPQRKRRTQ